MNKLCCLDLYTTAAAFNLAAEQYVFDSLPRDRSYFMLWQNDNAVIVGRYQNTVCEINGPYVREQGITVVRRLSGGGAVYHDLGNLNYTFITDAAEAENMNLQVFCLPVIRTLEKLGVKAELNGRNDMVIEGKKFSGNSQYIKNGRIMHHGTLLFSSDLEKVRLALTPDAEKLSSKGIDSVRSRVTNISEHISGELTIQAFRRLLLNNIMSELDGELLCFTDLDREKINELSERYSSWDWNYGKSPEGTVKRCRRIEGCGRLEAYISLNHGIISGLRFMGDYIAAENPEELENSFIGCSADRESLARVLEERAVTRYIRGIDKEQLIAFLIGDQ